VNIKAISQKTRLINPNEKLMRFPKRTYAISKPKIATKVKREPLTLRPFKTFLSFIIALIKRRTAIRLTILAKSKTMLTESIFFTF
jgi:hypothetical protein